jgi:hypothetical protein
MVLPHSGRLFNILVTHLLEGGFISDEVACTVSTTKQRKMRKSRATGLRLISRQSITTFDTQWCRGSGNVKGKQNWRRRGDQRLERRKQPYHTTSRFPRSLDPISVPRNHMRQNTRSTKPTSPSPLFVARALTVRAEPLTSCSIPG